MRVFRGFVAAASMLALQAGAMVAVAAEPQVPPPTDPRLFSDGFESGSLSAWGGGSGLTVSSTPLSVGPSQGAFSASAVMAGQSAHAYRDLAGPTTRLQLDLDVAMTNLGTASVNFAKVRTATGAAIAELYASPGGLLGLRNDVLGKATTSTVTIAPGLWHRATLSVVVAGSASTTSVIFDGKAVPALSLVTDLGTTPVGRIQVGENLSGRTAAVAYDDVRVTRLAPAVPTSVTATPTGLDVLVSWSASSDPDVGFAEVRRGSVVVGTTAGTTSWVDTNTSALTTYNYSVRAVDRYGHRSDWSPPATVTTPANGSVFVWPVSADAYVDAAKPSSVMGLRTELRVDASPVQRTYLRFEVSGIGTKAPAAPVLRVHAASALAAGFAALTVAGPWSESTLTYDNAPPVGTVLATSGPVTAGAWVEIPLPGFVSGDGTYDVALVPLSNTALRLDSREAGTPAELVADVTSAGSNAAPVAGNVSLVTDEGVDATWVPDVLDRDSALLTCTIATKPKFGVVTVKPDCSDGGYSLSGNSEFNGIETFSYRVTDGSLQATGTVTAQVRPVNDAPVAEYLASEAWDASRSTEFTVHAFDIDDPCRLTFQPQVPTEGALTLIRPAQCASGTTYLSYRYTPDEGWDGDVDISGVFRDPQGLQAPVALTLTAPDEPSDIFTVLASETSWVDSSKPTATHANSKSLILDASPQRQTYLRFPVTGVGATPPAALTLRLNTSALPAGHFIEVHTASGPWDEATLTWANAPEFGPVVARHAVPTSGFVDLAIPAELLAGDGTLDLVLTSTSSTQSTISGSYYLRTPFMPRLIVTK